MTTDMQELDARRVPVRTKTQKKLAGAMLRLYEKKGFEEINVRELCNEAGVARTSFYNYYNNTLELLEEIEDDLLWNMRQSTKDIVTERIDSMDSLAFMQGYLGFITENKDTFLIFLKKRPNGRFLQKWKDSTKDHIGNRMKVNQVYVDHQDFIETMISAEVVEALMYILEHPDECSWEEIRRYLMRYFTMWGLEAKPYQN